MQMLQCVKQPVTAGGDNIFSDGFNVARQMSEHFPEHFAALTELPVDFCSIGKESLDLHLRTRKPIVR